MTTRRSSRQPALCFAGGGTSQTAEPPPQSGFGKDEVETTPFLPSAFNLSTPCANVSLSGMRRKSLNPSSHTIVSVLNSKIFPLMFRLISVISHEPSPTSACLTRKCPPLSSHPKRPQ